MFETPPLEQMFKRTYVLRRARGRVRKTLVARALEAMGLPLGHYIERTLPQLNVRQLRNFGPKNSTWIAD